MSRSTVRWWCVCGVLIASAALSATHEPVARGPADTPAGTGTTVLASAASGTEGQSSSASRFLHEDRGASRKVPPPSDALVDMLELAIQDEYRAYGTYSQVIEDFGDIPPFSHIVWAEDRHIKAVSKLFTERGLDVPDDEVKPVGFATFKEACAAGVAAEVANDQMYENFLLSGPLPQDVAKVFTSLMEASRDRHLPAFERCAN